MRTRPLRRVRTQSTEVGFVATAVAPTLRFQPSNALPKYQAQLVIIQALYLAYLPQIGDANLRHPHSIQTEEHTNSFRDNRPNPRAAGHPVARRPPNL